MDYGRFEGFWGIKSAMEALGLNMKLFREGGLNGLQYMCHGDLWAAEDEEFPVPYDLQPYTVDGREYYVSQRSITTFSEDGLISSSQRVASSLLA